MVDILTLILSVSGFIFVGWIITIATANEQNEQITKRIMDAISNGVNKILFTLSIVTFTCAVSWTAMDYYKNAEPLGYWYLQTKDGLFGSWHPVTWGRWPIAGDLSYCMEAKSALKQDLSWFSGIYVRCEYIFN